MRIGADTEDTAHLAQPQHQVQVPVLPLDSRDYNLRYAHEPALSYIEGGRGGRESGLFSSEQRSNGSSLSRSPLSSNECALAERLAGPKNNADRGFASGCDGAAGKIR